MSYNHLVDPGEPEPRTISGPRHNISLPTDLVAHLGLATGDKVYLMVNPDRARTLVLISAATMKDVVLKGWASI